jgi:hypothetical protein
MSDSPAPSSLTPAPEPQTEFILKCDHCGAWREVDDGPQLGEIHDGCNVGAWRLYHRNGVWSFLNVLAQSRPLAARSALPAPAPEPTRTWVCKACGFIATPHTWCTGNDNGKHTPSDDASSTPSGPASDATAPPSNEDCVAGSCSCFGVCARVLAAQPASSDPPCPRSIPELDQRGVRNAVYCNCFDPECGYPHGANRLGWTLPPQAASGAPGGAAMEEQEQDDLPKTANGQLGSRASREAPGAPARAATADTIFVPGAWRYQKGLDGWYIVVGDEVADRPEDRYTSRILDALADALAGLAARTGEPIEEPQWLTEIREFYKAEDAPTMGPFRHHHEAVHRLLAHIATLSGETGEREAPTGSCLICGLDREFAVWVDRSLTAGRPIGVCARCRDARHVVSGGATPNTPRTGAELLAATDRVMQHYLGDDAPAYGDARFAIDCALQFEDRAKAAETRLASLTTDRDALAEWRDAILGTLEAKPEFHAAEWGGDKRGWGFVFEFINWLYRDRTALAARLHEAEQRATELRRVGAQLSNIAFNLAQGSKLDDGVRISLRIAYERWDDTTKTHAIDAALRASPLPEAGGATPNLGVPSSPAGR